MITVADRRFYKGIDYLFRSCFNTDSSYMKAYFGRMLSIGKNIVNTAPDGTVASSLTLFPCTISDGDSKFDVGYVFSVGTLEKYRLHGMATDLLEWTAKYARGMNLSALTLVPQSSILFDFYKARGYDTAFYVNKTLIRNYELPRKDCCADKVKFIKMNRGYDTAALFSKAHPGIYSMKWSRKMYEHLRIDSAISGGGLMLSQGSGDTMLAACFGRKRTDTVLVKDFSVPACKHEVALRGLSEALPAGNYEILTAPNYRVWECPVNNVPYGMAEALSADGENMLKLFARQPEKVFYSPIVD